MTANFYALVEESGAQAAIYVDPSATPNVYIGWAYCRGDEQSACRYKSTGKRADRIAEAADLAKTAWSAHARRLHGAGATR